MFVFFFCCIVSPIKPSNLLYHVWFVYLLLFDPIIGFISNSYSKVRLILEINIAR